MEGGGGTVVFQYMNRIKAASLEHLLEKLSFRTVSANEVNQAGSGHAFSDATNN